MSTSSLIQDMSSLARDINGFLHAMEHQDQIHNISPSVESFLQCCLADEYTLRSLFATDSENPILKCPYIGLFDVFDLPVRARLARPRDWDTSENEFIWKHEGEDHLLPPKYILPVEPDLRRTAGVSCMVDGLPTFCQAFNTFSGGALSAIKNWKNVVVAGGSVEACLTKPANSHKNLFDMYQSSAYQRSDIDLFLWGMKEDEAKKRMQEIFEAIRSSVPWDVVCFRTKNTITIQAEYPKRPIQIIMRLYRSPAEILCGFDVDCCCFAYNGTNVFTNPRGLTAIVRQCNTINLLRRSPSYEHRLAKYACRGYEVFYPLLKRDRINYRWLATPERKKFPNGLGRLIVHEIMAIDPQIFPELYADSDKRVRSAPVPLGALRHSNYDYAWVRIPYGLKWWDVQKVKEHVENVGQKVIKAISRNRRQGAAVHCHVITCGTMTECLQRCCEDHFDDEHDSKIGREDLPDGLFRGPATFITDDPGRQMVGSFNPTYYDVWELDAYHEDDDIEGNEDDEDEGDANEGEGAEDGELGDKDEEGGP